MDTNEASPLSRRQIVGGAGIGLAVASMRRRRQRPALKFGKN